MADCRRWEEDLKAYRDRELSWPARLRLRRHLAHCPFCRKEISQMTQIAEDLRASELSDAPLNAVLRDKILAAAPPPIAPAPAAEPARPARFLRGLTWATVSVIVLAVAIAFLPMISSHLTPERNIGPNVAAPSLEPHLIHQRTSTNPGPPPAPAMAAGGAVPMSSVAVGRDGGGYPGGGGLGAVGGPQATAGADGAVPQPVPVVLPRSVSSLQTPVSVAHSPGSLSTSSLDIDVTTRQVHNEANIGVQVNNPEVTSDQVAQMATDAGGYVAENDLSTNDDGTKTATLAVEVPVAEFSDVLARVAKLGDVQSKSITGQDITDKTSDAQQAEMVMENEVAQAQARLAKLGKHASWDDAQTARDLTVQLAQARARLVLLHKLGELSEIDVTLTQKPAPTPPVQSGFVSGLSGTTRSATQSLLSSAGLMLDLLIWILAYAPLWLPLALIARVLYRRYSAGATRPMA